MFDSILLTAKANQTELNYLIICAFLLLVIIFAYFHTQKEDKNFEGFQKLAKSLGLRFDKPRHPYRGNIIVEIKGTYNGIHLEVYIDRVRGDRGRGKYFTVIRMQVNKKKDFELSLGKEGFLQKVGKVLGMQDIQTGYPEFDEAFVLQSNEPKTVLEIFDTNLSSKFSDNHTLFYSTVNLSQTLLTYKEETLLSTEASTRRFEMIAKLLVDLAVKIEQVSKPL